MTWVILLRSSASLFRWYQEGLDSSIRPYQLSALIGHVEPRSTSVYLTTAPAGTT
jgi:hypothetical protein